MSPDDLDRLDALAAAATPGPWQWLDSGGDPGDYDELQDGNGEMVASGFRDDVLSDITDGRLCAALRNAAPQLIAAARLGTAWQAAEAALPEGTEGLYVERDRLAGAVSYYAGTWPAMPLSRHPGTDAGHGPTPAAALLSLAEALRGRK